jgi:Ca2+/Na+ antiporter
VIGGVVLAAVTSLPNAVAAVYLARRGRGSAVLSEAVNSNSFNVLFGLLVPAVIIGVSGHSGVALEVAAWNGGLTAVALALAYRGRGLTRVSGAVVVGGYLALVGLLVAR